MCDCAFAFSWEPPIFGLFLKKGMLFVWEGISMHKHIVFYLVYNTRVVYYLLFIM